MSMKCAVYRSNRKDCTYLYVPETDDFSRVPTALRDMLGPLEHVLSFELTPDRKLASENPVTVLSHLETQGWYLQFPKDAFHGSGVQS